MSRLHHRALAGAALGVSLLGFADRASAQCTKDIECKGDRICSDGACVDPSPAPPPLPPSASGAGVTQAEKPPAGAAEEGPMEPRSPAMRTTGIVLTAAGTVAAVVSVVFLVEARSERDATNADCPNNLCTTPVAIDHLDKANTFATAGTVTLLSAGALLGAGIPLYFVGRHEVPASKPQPAAWIPRQVSIQASRVVLTVNF
jgi:hypothetical protein